MKRLMSGIAAACLAPLAWTHGGEDHGDVGHSPLATASIASRLEAKSDDFELVAVLAEGKLTVYLDRYADNAPVADAEIEIEGDGFKAAASQIAPGVYRAPAQNLVRPGRHPLTISVQAGDVADLLGATLDLALPADGVGHVHGWSEWAVWGASGALLLAGAGLVALRRRQTKRRQHH